MARAVRIVLSLIAALALASAGVLAQTSVNLAGRTVRDVISSNGDAVTMTLRVGESMGSAKFQSLDSYSGTIEAQCSLDGTNWDTGNEPLLQLLGGTATASSVTDTTGIWDIVGAAGCRAIRIISTAGFAASDTTIIISFLPSGGGGGGGGGGVGGGDFDITTFNAAFGTAGTPDSQVLTVQGDPAGTPIPVLDTSATPGLMQDLLDSLSDPAVHGNAVATAPDGIPIMCEAKDVDGAALPNTVTEGQFTRCAATLSGIALTHLVTEDGTKSPVNNEDTASANTDAGLVIFAIRDDTLDVRSATEGDFEYLHTNANGALWTIDVNSAALLTALQTIDNAETAASHYAYTSAGATEDEHVVVAAPAVLWSITATNTAATVAYLRCENQDELSDGAPGTDTLAAATDLDLAIPGQTTGAGITFSFARGLSFSVGLKCWITTGEAYSSVAEVGADDVKLLYSYK